MSHLTWARRRTPKESISQWPEPKITVPNTTPSLRKLLEQHSRGMPLPQEREGQYFGDMEVPDFEQMDPIEIKEFRDNLRADIDNMERIRREAEQEPPASPQKEAVFADPSEKKVSEAIPSQTDMVKAIREALKIE